MQVFGRNGVSLRGTASAMILVGMLALTGCSGRTPQSDSSAQEDQSPKNRLYEGEYPIKATVTIGMIADLVRAIGGEHVSVTQLMSSGVDPHLHKASRDDAVAIKYADIVFYNGLMLEGKMSDLLGQIGKNQRTFACAETLSAEVLGSDPQEHAHPDPHVWMNVEMWSEVAQAICEELSAFDPEHADDYAAETTRLRAQLAELHQYGQQMMATIPRDRRVLVTSHDAFRYFGAAYDVEVQAIQGISTESEAGLSRINELVDMLVDREIVAVFAESSVPDESIRALLKGAENRGHKVAMGKKLFSDAMGSSGTYEGTYIGMMDFNFSNIARGLGSEGVPEGGFRDWKTSIVEQP